MFTYVFNTLSFLKILVSFVFGFFNSKWIRMTTIMNSNFILPIAKVTFVFNNYKKYKVVYWYDYDFIICYIYNNILFGVSALFVNFFNEAEQHIK